MKVIHLSQQKRRKIKPILDPFEAFAARKWDESKANRGEKGTDQGGRFQKKGKGAILQDRKRGKGKQKPKRTPYEGHEKWGILPPELRTDVDKMFGDRAEMVMNGFMNWKNLMDVSGDSDADGIQFYAPHNNKQDIRSLELLVFGFCCLYQGADLDIDLTVKAKTINAAGMHTGASWGMREDAEHNADHNYKSTVTMNRSILQRSQSNIHTYVDQVSTFAHELAGHATERFMGKRMQDLWTGLWAKYASLELDRPLTDEEVKRYGGWPQDILSDAYVKMRDFNGMFSTIVLPRGYAGTCACEFRACMVQEFLMNPQRFKDRYEDVHDVITKEDEIRFIHTPYRLFGGRGELLPAFRMFYDKIKDSWFEGEYDYMLEDE